jgi:hypothetical protein
MEVLTCVDFIKSIQNKKDLGKEIRRYTLDGMLTNERKGIFIVQYENGLCGIVNSKE